MGKLIDLTNQKFGRLTVVRRAESDNGGRTKWVCKCDCGNEKEVYGTSLTRPSGTKSCGCLTKERAKETKTKHGKSNTKIYYVWNSMIQRCNNPNTNNFDRYGGRAKNPITICDEWKNNFKSFYDWSVVNGFMDGLSIDRIDNNKGYSPDNCRWVDKKVQANNTSRNHFITYKGRTQTIAQWADELGVNVRALYTRLERGLSIKEAFTYVNTRTKLMTYNGKTQTVSQWARELNIKSSVLYARLDRGWSIEKTLSTPINHNYSRTTKK